MQIDLYLDPFYVHYAHQVVMLSYWSLDSKFILLATHEPSMGDGFKQKLETIVSNKRSFSTNIC